MRVVLYGATGKAGSRILTELLDRGHSVVAIVRDPAKLGTGTNLTVERGDLSTVDGIVEHLQDANAVISAYAAPPGDVDQLVTTTEHLIAAMSRTLAVRFLMVGGAGTLEVSPGVPLMNTPSLPEEWRPVARAHGRALELLRASSINWTYLCPAGLFEPGTRTGKFRLSNDRLLTDDSQQSRISMEDYAIAMVDELERGEHIRQRFAAAY